MIGAPIVEKSLYPALQESAFRPNLSIVFSEHAQSKDAELDVTTNSANLIKNKTIQQRLGKSKHPF
jgi:hypothetical protein